MKHKVSIKIDIDNNIGLQMQNICDQLNLKHKDVAIGIGISESLLSYYMNNKRTQKIDILKKFLNFCRERNKHESH